MGVVHKADPGWASFIPMLIRALDHTEGAVLELGMGNFSTPLLHVLCEDQNRLLTSYENDSRFTDMFSRFKNGNHQIELIDSWDQPLIIGSHWSVVLVDSKPAESRKELIKELYDAKIVIIHDSQDPAYEYDEIYSLFKYRYDYPRLTNRTTALSNKYNVENILRNPLD